MRVENAKAGRKKNFAYCTKDDTRVAGPWFVNCTAADANRKSGNQGKRTDLDDFALVCLEYKWCLRSTQMFITTD